MGSFLADVELHGNAIDITLTGLDRFTLLPVDGDPLSSLDIPVDETGAFEAPFAGIIPGDANTLTGSELTVDVTLVGRIRDEDTFCGDAIGDILKPIVLDIMGSTFGVLRIEPGTVGDDLPEIVAACPE